MYQNLLSKDIQQFWLGAGHLCPDDPAQLSLSMFSSEHSLSFPEGHTYRFWRIRCPKVLVKRSRLSSIETVKNELAFTLRC